VFIKDLVEAGYITACPRKRRFFGPRFFYFLVVQGRHLETVQREKCHIFFISEEVFFYFLILQRKNFFLEKKLNTCCQTLKGSMGSGDARSALHNKQVKKRR
jgi:hypothetical protein